MELERIAKEMENIRDRQLSLTLQNEAYHFANRQEQIYKKQKPEIFKHQSLGKILACEGIIYLIGTGNIEVLSPTHRIEYVTPFNKNIELLRAQAAMFFVDPALKEIQKTIQPKEIPITYKTMLVDVFSDSKLREIWKLGRDEFTYESIFSQKSASARQQTQTEIARGRDTGSLSARMRKTLSE